MRELLSLFWTDALFVLGLVAATSNAWGAAGGVPWYVAAAGTVAAGSVSGVQVARKLAKANGA